MTFIIIVTHNAMLWIDQCLKSIKNHQVIIVENGSSDGTLAYVQAKYNSVILLPQKTNLGFGQANNIGISYALDKGAKYIFLLNQDAYLEPRCIEKLIELQINFPEYGILSPLHLNGQGDKLDQNFTHYLNYQANPDFYSDYVLNKPKRKVYDVPFVNAAGWLLSKKCVEKVGGFDPIFFHYGEDDNYCQRLHYHGFKIGVCPEARLLHDRENRSGPEVLFGDQKYFQVMERQLKLKFADINKPWNKELDMLIHKRRNAWLKTKIKMDFKGAAFYRNEYLMLQRIKSEILASREKNKLPGLKV